MRFWVLLLLQGALSAARLRPGRAEGDPLPQSLVDLLRNSPISSVDDLKLLLQNQSNATEEEDVEDEHDAFTKHGRYSRSLAEVQLAHQAVCKTRTEVMEVTRSMLDRRHANFMLWPPCVEVQRCSGCCNTRRMQCVPTVTSSRYLQVTKIQYINGNPQLDKAIISVEDHVSCSCQPSSSSSSSSSSSLPISRPSIENSVPPQPPPPSPRLPLPLPQTVPPAPPKVQSSKADLHRHDDQKHNQQHRHPEERNPVARQWQSGSYTQLVHWTPMMHQVQPGAYQPKVGAPDSRWPSEARAEHSFMGNTQPVGHSGGYEGSREASGVHVANGGGGVHHPDHNHHQKIRHGGAEGVDQHRLNAPQSDGSSPPGSGTETPGLEPVPTPPVSTCQKDSETGQKTAGVTNHRQTEPGSAAQQQGKEREESGSAHSADSTAAETVKDSKVTGGDRGRKIVEAVQQELDRETPLHPPHPQQQPEPTTSKTAPPTMAPIPPSARQAPSRPPPRRRRRKHRKRISKAAIRAMIM